MQFPNKKLLILILAAAGFLVYAFNSNNPLFWDDDDWIKGNVFIHDFSHLKEIFTENVLSGFGLNGNYYRPLLLLSFAFNYVIGGIEPLGYHLVSNGLHIANGILIFLLLRAFISQRSAFLAALLFLIHPLQTEAVTYISGRGDPMSVFFMLTGLWLLIKGQPAVLEIRRKRLYFTASLAMMILGILSRETAVLFPVLLMIYYIAFLTAKPFFRAFKEALIKSLPYWTVAIVYFVLRLTVFNFKNTLNFYSQANEYTRHLSYRLYTFGEVLIEYFKLIFVPVGLHMERDLPVKTSIFQWPVPLAAAILTVIIFIGIILLRRSKKPEPNTYDPEPRLWFFGWFWFFAALGPVSGIVPINALIYEHWLYLPLIGFFALATFYFDKFLDFLKSRSTIGHKLLVAALIGYFGFFGAAAAKRNLAWGDTESFYRDILKYNPASVRILNNLGNLYSGKDEPAKAIDFYQRAISSPLGNIFAQPHYNLGNVYRDQGHLDKATVEYNKAIEIDPSFPFAYQNLAAIYAGQGDLASAALMLEKVKKLRPQEPRVYYNLALIYLAQRKDELALENLKIALSLAANDPEALAQIKAVLGKIAKK